MDDGNAELVATLRWTDPATGEQVFFCVRRSPDRILIAVSMKSDGDFELALDVAAAEHFAGAIRDAISRGRSSI
jgi:hypothetical protein